MKEKNQTKQEEITFNTEGKFAAFKGFLIVPAITTTLSFIGALIIVIFADPKQLTGSEYYLYYTDMFTIPFVIVIAYLWIKRKKALKYLMIFYFALLALSNIFYLSQGFTIDIINLFMSLIWATYFIISRRVKQTFIY